MTGDREPGDGGHGVAQRNRQLRAVGGPLAAHEPPPAVRLVREFKGLTVADLMRDELAARLPGEVRSALRHLEHVDRAGMERALPGESTPVLPGPGHRRRERRLLFAAVGFAAIVAATAFAAWLAG